jgi:secreted trypsin-like serine protease
MNLLLLLFLAFLASFTRASNHLRGITAATEGIEERWLQKIRDRPIDIGDDDRKGQASRSPNTRIVGGDEATRGEQPNFAMLLYLENGGYHFGGCGGTLISNCHILTAAHCITKDRDPLMYGVYINAYKPYNGNDNEPYHFSTIRNVMAHPNYSRGNTYDDIAVITMETCVGGSSYFMENTMKLADSNYLEKITDGQLLTVSGFGAQSEVSSVYSSTLRMVQVPYISHEMCKYRYDPKLLSNDEICAGSAQGGKDACQGDSGGPMFLNDGKNQYQIGVVSRGYGCARPNSPGIYSSVAYHYEFIRKQVCHHSRSNSLGICNVNATASTPTSGTNIVYDTQMQTEYTPSNIPTTMLTVSPSSRPSILPTQQKSISHTDQTIRNPALVPTSTPSLSPSLEPSLLPKQQLSLSPTGQHNRYPTCVPTSTLSNQSQDEKLEGHSPSTNIPSLTPTSSDAPSLNFISPSQQPSYNPSDEMPDLFEERHCSQTNDRCMYNSDCCGSLTCRRRNYKCFDYSRL